GQGRPRRYPSSAPAARRHPPTPAVSGSDDSWLAAQILKRPRPLIRCRETGQEVPAFHRLRRRWVMAQTLSESIHPTAVIDPEAQVAPGVQIGPYAVIEGPVEIGPGCVLEAHACLSGPLVVGRVIFV